MRNYNFPPLSCLIIIFGKCHKCFWQMPQTYLATATNLFGICHKSRLRPSRKSVCFDNAIHSAAGVQLRLECAALKQRLGREARTGEAFLTQGYNLPSRYVVHTVGSIIADGVPTRGQEVELANCYRHCLEKATEKRLVSIAFCCISTGVFMFPQGRAAEIAVGAVSGWLSAHTTTISTVVFNVFKDSDAEIYQRLLQETALQSPE